MITFDISNIIKDYFGNPKQYIFTHHIVMIEELFIYYNNIRNYSKNNIR